MAASTISTHTITTTLSPTSTPSSSSNNVNPVLPSYISDNVLYTINYNVNQGLLETIIDLVNFHYNDGDISAAYAKCSGYIEACNQKFRPSKASNADKKLRLLISWLQNSDKSKLPEIFADSPYTLPIPKDVDLHIVTVNNTAKKALSTVNSLSSDLSKISDDITHIRNGMLYASVADTKISDLINSVTLMHEVVGNIRSDIGALQKNQCHCNCKCSRKDKDENNEVSTLLGEKSDQREQTTTPPQYKYAHQGPYVKRA